MNADLELVGARVLANLAAGREKANLQSKARAQVTAELVVNLADADMLAGKPELGRAGRIARKIGISERHAKRILDTLSSVSDLVCYIQIEKEKSSDEKCKPQSAIASDARDANELSRRPAARV